MAEVGDEDKGRSSFWSALSGLFSLVMISQGAALGCGWTAPLGLPT
jgi:hypothetical protein